MDRIFITEVSDIVFKERYPQLWELNNISDVGFGVYFYIWVGSICDANTIYHSLGLIPDAVLSQHKDITDPLFRFEYNPESNKEFIDDFMYRCHMKAIELEQNNQLIGRTIYETY